MRKIYLNNHQMMGISPLKKRINCHKCSFATKQHMFGVFAIDEILRYRGSRIPGSRTLCHPVTTIAMISCHGEFHWDLTVRVNYAHLAKVQLDTTHFASFWMSLMKKEVSNYGCHPFGPKFGRRNRCIKPQQYKMEYIFSSIKDKNKKDIQEKAKQYWIELCLW